MAHKSRIPFFRRKGESRSMYDEPDTGDLPQRRAGLDKGEPKGAMGAKGTGTEQVESSFHDFVKKRKKVRMERGGK